MLMAFGFAMYGDEKIPGKFMLPNIAWLRGLRMVGVVQTGQLSANGVGIYRSFPA